MSALVPEPRTETTDVMKANEHPIDESDLAVVAGLRTAGRGDAAPSFAAADASAASTRSWLIGDLETEWVCAPGTGNAGVLLYLHGGRFQREEQAATLAGPLSAAAGLPVLLVHYRLAPEHPYPAALDDTVSAYRALLGLGYGAEQIAIAGHSSGATLALSALSRLRDADLPMPACVASISPITDFTLSGATLVNAPGADSITVEDAHQVRAAYLGDADPAGAPQSPLAADPDGLPPLLIACGGDELLRDDAVRFAEQADAAGVRVDLEIYAGMPHGFALTAARAAADLRTRIGGFVAARLNGGVPDVPARPLTVRRLGWAGVEIVTERGTRLVLDPYLSGSEGAHSGLPESSITPAELGGADIVAVTHAGYDHRGQALEVMQAGNATMVSGTAMFAAALGAGIPIRRLAATVSGVEFRYRDVTIKALPAQHESSMKIGDSFIADQPQSYLVTTADGSRILCAGDSSLSEQFRTWGEIYRPDVAILGIGGVPLGRAWVTELQPAEAAIATRWLGVSTVIAVHHQPGDPAPVQLAADLGEDAQVVALDFGQTWEQPTRG